ncbi:MAG TPA: type II secretion system F family protein [Terriglobia bacterium]|nr:type II secretion system F family protein [Terriglobia bacterium]
MEWQYKAKNDEGRTVTGIMEADDEDALASALDERNLFLVEAAPARRVNGETPRQRKIKARDILNFTIDLSTILASGIPITEGLRDLSDSSEHVKLKNIIDDVLASINAGSSLSSAFERHPQVFDTLYVSIVRAGETSGSLDRVLGDLANFLEWKGDLRREVVQALIYPCMVLSAILGLITLLATVVFPEFAKVLIQSKGPIPLPTRILFFLSTLFRSYWWAMLLLVFASAIGFWFWIRTPRGRAAWDAFKLRIPVVGNLVQDIALSRFCHFFQILFSAGVDISQTLSIVEQLVGNTVLADATRTVRNEVRAGNSLSSSLTQTGKFPTMVIRMFHIGEQSGQLVGSLEKTCRYYDKEIPATIKRVFSILEPVLYVFLAVIVLTVALAIYMPLYQMMGSLSRH